MMRLAHRSPTPRGTPIIPFDAGGCPQPASTSVEDLVRPTVRMLVGGAANPFRTITAICFYAPRARNVRLDLYEFGGRLARLRFEQPVEPSWGTMRACG